MDIDRFRSEQNFLGKMREKKDCDNPKEDRKKKDERFRAEREEGRDEIILISRCTTLNIKWLNKVYLFKFIFTKHN